MDRPTRIAVVGPIDDRLLGDLRQLPLRPEVRACRSLTIDTEALLHFQPLHASSVYILVCPLLGQSIFKN